MFIHLFALLCLYTSVKVRGELADNNLQLAACRGQFSISVSRGSNSGCQDWWQVPLVAPSHLILLSSEFPGLCNLNSLELKWPSEANKSTWISIVPTFLPQPLSAVLLSGRKAVWNLILPPAGCVLELHPVEICFSNNEMRGDS